MSSNKTMAAAVAAVVVAAIAVAAAATFIDDNGNDGADTQEVDYWYQVAYSGYSGDKYYQTGDYNPSFYDIAVYQHGNGVFCGSSYGSHISGTLTDNGFMSFYTEAYGETYYFEGQISGTTMTGITIGVDGDGDLYAMYVVYSADPLATAETTIDAVDLTGSWSLKTAAAVNDGQTTDLKGTALTVTAQTGAVFYGTLEEDIDGTVESMSFTAVMKGNAVGSYQYGLLIDSAGDVWVVLTDGQSLLLQITAIEEKNGTAAPVATERTFCRAGTAAAVSFDVPDVAGVTWTETEAYAARTWNTIEAVFTEHTMTVEYQDGRMFSGTDTFAGVSTPFAAYFCSSTEFMVSYGSTTAGPQASFGYGILAGDALQLTKTVRGTAGTEGDTYNWATVQAAMTAAAPAVPTDITGHWYAAWATGYYPASGKTLTVSIGDIDGSSYLIAYGLTVTAQQGATFQGVYQGQQIVGSYADGQINFIAPINSTEYPGTEFFTAYMLNEHVFVTIEEYEYDDGSISIWSSYYTDKVMVVAPAAASEELAGTWTVYKDDAFWYDGANTGTLKGTTLTLSTSGRLLIGTIDEEVDGVVKEKSIVGLPGPDGHSFWLIDEDDYAYYAYRYGDTLGMVSVDFFDTATVGKLLGAERVYVRNGSEPVRETRCPNLDGTTWTASEGTYHYADGTVKTADGVDLTFTQLSTDWLTNLVGGTATIGGLGENISFCGYVNSADGQIILNIKDSYYIGMLYPQEDKTVQLLLMSEDDQYVLEVTLTQQ